MGKFKVYRGKKNYRDVGRVIEFNEDDGNFPSYFTKQLSILITYAISNGIFHIKRINSLYFFFLIHENLRVIAEEMSIYDDDECNKYYGTDQTVFPAFMNPDDGVGAFEPIICRTLVRKAAKAAFLLNFFLSNS